MLHSITDITCPNCKTGKLKEFKHDDKTLLFTCKGRCKSTFEPEYIYDLNEGKRFLKIKMRNSGYINRLNGRNTLEILTSIVNLDSKRVPFHIKEYVVREINLW